VPKLTSKQKQVALDKIADQIRNCRICKRYKVGMAVPGEGNPDADIVFIGEAPGKQEAATGRPFIGRAGKLLRGLLADIGIRESYVYITSPVKYLPVYVTPKPDDIAHGRLHLFQQLDIIDPKVAVLMGNTAAMAVLQEKFPIAADHGKIIKREGMTYFLSYHPAAPLYSPKLRAVITKDFRKLKKVITQL
jgi:DNA polymerase